MDKISFIIPNKEDYNNFDLKNNDKFVNNLNKVNKTTIINDYKKIAPNVYRFDTKNIKNLDANIYDLFNIACQEKKVNKINAINIFKKCRELITQEIKDEIKYEIFINLALLVSDNGGSKEEIHKYYQEALNIFSDRAEPYYYWSMYCNKIENFETSYNLLKKASLITYEEAKNKYPGTQRSAYDKFLYDELSVACYWLKKYDEAKELIVQIIDDPDFSVSRERLLKNLDFINQGLQIQDILI